MIQLMHWQITHPFAIAIQINVTNRNVTQVEANAKRWNFKLGYLLDGCFGDCSP